MQDNTPSSTLPSDKPASTSFGSTKDWVTKNDPHHSFMNERRQILPWRYTPQDLKSNLFGPVRHRSHDDAQSSAVHFIAGHSAQMSPIDTLGIAGHHEIRPLISVLGLRPRSDEDNYRRYPYEESSYMPMSLVPYNRSGFAESGFASVVGDNARLMNRKVLEHLGVQYKPLRDSNRDMRELFNPMFKDRQAAERIAKAVGGYVHTVHIDPSTLRGKFPRVGRPSGEMGGMTLIDQRKSGDAPRDLSQSVATLAKHPDYGEYIVTHNPSRLTKEGSFFHRTSHFAGSLARAERARFDHFGSTPEQIRRRLLISPVEDSHIRPLISQYWQNLIDLHSEFHEDPYHHSDKTDYNLPRVLSADGLGADHTPPTTNLIYSMGDDARHLYAMALANHNEHAPRIILADLFDEHGHEGAANFMRASVPHQASGQVKLAKDSNGAFHTLVWHNSETNEPIENFDINKASKTAVVGPAFYFSQNPGFWNLPGSKGVDRPYLIGGNIIDLTKPLPPEHHRSVAAIAGRNPEELNYFPVITLEHKFGSVAKGLEAAGFDGAWHLGPKNSTNLAMFKPHLIKPASASDVETGAGAPKRAKLAKDSKPDANWQPMPGAPVEVIGDRDGVWPTSGVYGGHADTPGKHVIEKTEGKYKGKEREIPEHRIYAPGGFAHMGPSVARGEIAPETQQQPAASEGDVQEMPPLRVRARAGTTESAFGAQKTQPAQQQFPAPPAPLRYPEISARMPFAGNQGMLEPGDIIHTYYTSKDSHGNPVHSPMHFTPRMFREFSDDGKIVRSHAIGEDGTAQMPWFAAPATGDESPSFAIVQRASNTIRRAAAGHPHLAEPEAQPPQPTALQRGESIRVRPLGEGRQIYDATYGRPLTNEEFNDYAGTGIGSSEHQRGGMHEVYKAGEGDSPTWVHISDINPDVAPSASSQPAASDRRSFSEPHDLKAGDVVHIYDWDGSKTDTSYLDIDGGGKHGFELLNMDDYDSPFQKDPYGLNFANVIPLGPNNPQRKSVHLTIGSRSFSRLNQGGVSTASSQPAAPERRSFFEPHNLQAGDVIHIFRWSPEGHENLGEKVNAADIGTDGGGKHGFELENAHGTNSPFVEEHGERFAYAIPLGPNNPSRQTEMVHLGSGRFPRTFSQINQSDASTQQQGSEPWHPRPGENVRLMDDGQFMRPLEGMYHTYESDRNILGLHRVAIRGVDGSEHGLITLPSRDIYHSSIHAHLGQSLRDAPRQLTPEQNAEAQFSANDPIHIRFHSPGDIGYGTYLHPHIDPSTGKLMHVVNHTGSGGRAPSKMLVDAEDIWHNTGRDVGDSWNHPAFGSPRSRSEFVKHTDPQNGNRVWVNVGRRSSSSPARMDQTVADVLSDYRLGTMIHRDPETGLHSVRLDGGKDPVNAHRARVNLASPANQVYPYFDAFDGSPISVIDSANGKVYHGTYRGSAQIGRNDQSTRSSLSAAGMPVTEVWTEDPSVRDNEKHAHAVNIQTEDGPMSVAVERGDILPRFAQGVAHDPSNHDPRAAKSISLLLADALHDVDRDYSKSQRERARDLATTPHRSVVPPLAGSAPAAGSFGATSASPAAAPAAKPKQSKSHEAPPITMPLERILYNSDESRFGQNSKNIRNPQERANELRNFFKSEFGKDVDDQTIMDLLRVPRAFPGIDPNHPAFSPENIILYVDLSGRVRSEVESSLPAYEFSANTTAKRGYIYNASQSHSGTRNHSTGLRVKHISTPHILLNQANAAHRLGESDLNVSAAMNNPVRFEDDYTGGLVWPTYGYTRNLASFYRDDDDLFKEAVSVARRNNPDLESKDDGELTLNDLLDSSDGISWYSHSEPHPSGGKNYPRVRSGSMIFYTNPSSVSHRILNRKTRRLESNAAKGT